jgi:hypothetical protein
MCLQSKMLYSWSTMLPAIIANNTPPPWTGKHTLRRLKAKPRSTCRHTLSVICVCALDSFRWRLPEQGCVHTTDHLVVHTNRVESSPIQLSQTHKDAAVTLWLTLRPIHTKHAVPLPCSDSAVPFVKVRVVAGNIVLYCIVYLHPIDHYIW